MAAALCAAFALPAPGQAAADEGGMAYGDATSASGGWWLSSRRSVLLGRTMNFRGTVPGTAAGDLVTVQRLGRDDEWMVVATATVGEDGTFLATWQTDAIGRIAVRALPAASAEGEVRAASAAPLRRVTIFRPALATWYGPGFYGRRTACGRRMTRRLQGVAHPKLPCGTEVDLFYKGRTVTVPVVDRGPFRPGTSWDLTAATARALRFRHTDTIGAARVRDDAA